MQHGAAPALQHAAHGQVQIFRERIAGPAAGLFDRQSVPHAGRTVERHGQAGAEARFLFHCKMRVQQKTLHPGQPVVVAVGMAPARLHKGQAVIGQQHRQGAAQEIGRRHKVGVEHGDERRVGVRKPEGQVAGLEALAVAAAQQPQVGALRHKAGQALSQYGVIFCVAVIQQLDGQAIARPVQRAGGRSNTQRHRAFIADRQLHQHMRQFVFGQMRQRQVRALARHPQPAQHGQLAGQNADGDQDGGESGGEGIAEHEHWIVRPLFFPIPKTPVFGQFRPSAGRTGPNFTCGAFFSKRVQCKMNPAAAQNPVKSRGWD